MKTIRKCVVCKKPTRALSKVHGKCMRTYVRAGKGVRVATVRKCGVVI